jgi:hypothetical protein
MTEDNILEISIDDEAKLRVYPNNPNGGCTMYIGQTPNGNIFSLSNP